MFVCGARGERGWGWHLGALAALFREERAHLLDGIVSTTELRGGGGALAKRVFVRPLHHGDHLVLAPKRLLAIRQQFVEPSLRASELSEDGEFVCVRGGRGAESALHVCA